MLEFMRRKRESEEAELQRPAVKAKATPPTGAKRGAEESTGNAHVERPIPKAKISRDLAHLERALGREILHIEMGDCPDLTPDENAMRTSALVLGINQTEDSPPSTPEWEGSAGWEDADVSAFPFERERVLKGMACEMASLQKFGVYTEISEYDPRVRSARVINRRWVCVDKGDPDKVKARLVAMEINRGDPMEGSFAATPSTTAVRTALFVAVWR